MEARSPWPKIISDLEDLRVHLGRFQEEHGEAMEEFLRVQKAKRDAEELKAVSGMW
jgi:hypothetical protein